MTDTTALRDLLAKVEAGWPNDNDTAYMPPINAGFGVGFQSACAWQANNGDLNDAACLAKLTLPGWHWTMDSAGAGIYNPGVEGDSVVFAHEGEPARALLICIIEAMIWESENA